MMRSLMALALASLTLLMAPAALACSVQLGRPDSCYVKRGDNTYYGPGSGTRGRIYEIGEPRRHHGYGARTRHSYGYGGRHAYQSQQTYGYRQQHYRYLESHRYEQTYQSRTRSHVYVPEEPYIARATGRRGPLGTDCRFDRWGPMEGDWGYRGRDGRCHVNPQY